MKYVKKVEGNVIYPNFALHRATIAMEDRNSITPIHHLAEVIELPLDPANEPLPDELITITNFLREYHPDDYDEIGTQISLSCASDAPGHVILQEVLTTLESDKPELFEEVSRVLTGVH